jgi:hypothetical protein
MGVSFCWLVYDDNSDAEENKDEDTVCSTVES